MWALVKERPQMITQGHGLRKFAKGKNKNDAVEEFAYNEEQPQQKNEKTK